MCQRPGVVSEVHEYRQQYRPLPPASTRSIHTPLKAMGFVPITATSHMADAAPITAPKTHRQISYAAIAARTLMSVLFIASGTSKLTSQDFTKKYMEAYGVPSYLLYPAAALELASGTMLLLGIMLHELGVVLVAWCLLTASIFHREWQGDDGQTQQIMFMKNLCMAGGFLMMSEGRDSGVRGVRDVLSWVKEKLRAGSSDGDTERQPLMADDRLRK